MYLNNFRLTVNVDGEPLEEYSLEHEVRDHYKQTTCYIASEADSPFQLHLCNNSDDFFVYDVYMDGRLVATPTIIPHSRAVLSGSQVDETIERPFVFGAVVLTDDDAFLNCSQVPLNELGTIRVNMYRAKFLGTVPTPVSTAVGNVPIIHERSKKASEHCVRFGAPVHRENPGTAQVEYIDKYPESPYSSFIFKYRSKDILQAQGIIQARRVRPGRPVDQHHDEAGPSRTGLKRRRGSHLNKRQVKVKTKDEEDSDPDIEELLAEQAALETRIRKARARQMKREASPIVLGDLNGEVIDLTIDE